MKKRRLTILGSTGSIGTQSLEIVDQFPEFFSVEAISCNKDIETFYKQLCKYKPSYGVVVDVEACNKLLAMLKENGFSGPTQILQGQSGLKQIVELEAIDTVIVAIVGNDALVPTWAAIQGRKRICLANKEVLVTAGHLIMPEVKAKQVELIPVDSEHSALFQSLQGSKLSEVEKVILTASGGPFRGKSKAELIAVKAQAALKHPQWEMGKKISIDSSTLMNKGLEVIEAKWLFDLEPEQIDVVVHPQSIIHSMVQFKDSSVISQMGLPDMRLPILYAMSWPDRVESDLERMDLAQIGTLTFEKPDEKTFPCLRLAYEAMKKGGTVPTVLNAANEVLVERYLNDDIGYYDIPEGIEWCIQQISHVENPDLEMVLAYDQKARNVAAQYCRRY